MPRRACVDASFVLKVLVPEAGTEEAIDLLTGWREEGVILCAPTLIEYEAVSALRNYVLRRLLTPEEGERARLLFSSLPLALYSPAGLLDLAWEYAEKLGQANIYDSCYLALAAKLSCKLWTADARLANSVASCPVGFETAWSGSQIIASLHNTLP